MICHESSTLKRFTMEAMGRDGGKGKRGNSRRLKRVGR